MKKLLIAACTLLFALLCPLILQAGDNIPRAAWRIPIGQPPANPGGHKPEISNIDDGFWQGAPVGGFGAGTFSRSYRGHYERWHVKAGVHKYEDVPANQFAVFAQSEGGEAIAQVLATDKPRYGLSAWNWGYPAGSGGVCCALSKIVVHISVSATADQTNCRAVLACASQQLQRDQLSGRHLQLVCVESDKQAGHGFDSFFVGEHGGVVSRFHTWVQRRPE
jgi:hypothetical protein